MAEEYFIFLMQILIRIKLDVFKILVKYYTTNLQRIPILITA